MKRISFYCLVLVAGVGGEAVTSVDARRAIPDDNLEYPVLREQKSPSGETEPIGSGFYIRKDGGVFLVISQHVICTDSVNQAGKKECTLKSDYLIATSYVIAPGNVTAHKLSLNIKSLLRSGDLNLHNQYDVATVRVGTEKNQQFIEWVSGVGMLIAAQGPLRTVSQEFVKSFDKILVSNDVFVFGYPASLGLMPLQQYDHHRPLVKKGVIAGKNDLKKTFVLDIPAHPGNSGGLVLEVESQGLETKFRAIGIVIQLVPAMENGMKYGLTTQEIANSGYSIAVSMDPVIELIDSFHSKH